MKGFSFPVKKSNHHYPNTMRRNSIAAHPLAILFVAFFPIVLVAQENNCLELPEEYFNYANIVLPAYFEHEALVNADNTPEDNPTTDAGATLGRVLFYDKRLSLTNTQSCADCHKQSIGFTDDAQFSRGFVGGFTARNSMNLANARYYPTGAFFWDERAVDLEDQILQPIQDPIEMGLTLEELITKLESTEFYPGLFEDAFGTSDITADRIAKATSQFIRSMVSYQSKYDEGRAMVFPAGPDMPFPNFTASENRGKMIFLDPQFGGCVTCHGTEGFIAPEPRNNGLDLVYEDNGLGDVTGIEADNGRFKVPSLRGVELSAPYMHDGRFETLEEVIEHYSTGVQDHPNLSPQLRPGGPFAPPKHLNLSEEDKVAMVDFLKTLTDYEFIIDERWSDPFCISPVAVDEPEFEQFFHIYPNPAKDFIRIESKWLGEKVEARLMNMQGQVLKSVTLQGSIQEMNTRDLPRGVYFLHVSTSERKMVRKIVCN